MIQWLDRYVVRGIGVLFVVGMITILVLTVSSQMHRSPSAPVTPLVAAHR